MDIIISNVNNQPIYEQIYGQIKSLIISGKLEEGALLPSIRSLAKDLRISVITTKRAYDELEKDGYIYSVAGKGSYVAKKNTELLREAHLKEMEDHIRALFQLAPSCNLQTKDIIEMVNVIAMEESNECN